MRAKELLDIEGGFFGSLVAESGAVRGPGLQFGTPAAVTTRQPYLRPGPRRRPSTWPRSRGGRDGVKWGGVARTTFVTADWQTVEPRAPVAYSYSHS